VLEPAVCRLQYENETESKYSGPMFVCQHNGKIVESDESEINVFIDQLHHNFKITMGTLSIFLGMQIE